MIHKLRGVKIKNTEKNSMLKITEASDKVENKRLKGTILKLNKLTRYVNNPVDLENDVKRNQKPKDKKSKTSKNKNNDEKEKDKHTIQKCKYDNRGKCKDKANCGSYHPKKTCQSYNKYGTCSYGSQCTWRHPKWICHSWRRSGECQWKEQCFF